MILLRKILRQTGKQRQCDLVLIFLIGQQRGLLRVGEKSAFGHHHRMLAEITEKQLLAAALDFAGILRLKQRPELRLHRLRKHFAAGIGLRIKHLCAAVLRIRKLILMNGDADRIFRRIQNFQTVIHVRAFLICDARNALIVDRAVGIPRDCHLKAGDFQNTAQIKQNTEVDAFFRNAVRR